MLWPTLWALWLAKGGLPDTQTLLVFIAGVFIMRSAGCVINDIADRHIDGHVKRTCLRPLAQKAVTVKETLILLFLLSAIALGLALLCNRFTLVLAIIGALLTGIYPFLKRVTHLPQLGLGAAFAWSVPMAFAAETSHLPFKAWILFGAVLIWTVIYDTMYAMVDRCDDIKIGVKSTAILFGSDDVRWIAGLQCFLWLLFALFIPVFHLSSWYAVSLLFVAALFLYQQRLIKMRDQQDCFKAFLNNQWVGMVLFLGIALQLMSPT